MVTIWTSTWKVPSFWFTTRYQVLLAVVVNRTFTSGGYDFVRTLPHWSSPHKFYFRVLNFCSWSRPRIFFNSEIFLIYGSQPCMCWGWWGGHLINKLTTWTRTVSTFVPHFELVQWSLTAKAVTKVTTPNSLKRGPMVHAHLSNYNIYPVTPTEISILRDMVLLKIFQ